MIAFRKDRPEGDKPQKTSKDIASKLQQILDIIYHKEKYYPGSLHESSNISDLVEIVYEVLYNKNKKSIQLIVEKNKNNSLNITVDTIK